VSDLAVSNAGQITTHALGSCIGVCLFEPGRPMGGMLHYLLPDSAMGQGRPRFNPHMYADTGLVALLDELKRIGGNPTRMKAKIAGGANALFEGATLDIGKRNILAARKLLWQHRIPLVGEEVGGSISRTVRLDIRTGTVTLTTPGQPPRTL